MESYNGMLEKPDPTEKNVTSHSQFMENGSTPPAPPGPGEIMVCLYCGNEMPPGSFPKGDTPSIKIKRKYMFTWHMCETCMNNRDSFIDDIVEEAERKKGLSV